jgi:hypothetical protein
MSYVTSTSFLSGISRHTIFFCLRGFRRIFTVLFHLSSKDGASMKKDLVKNELQSDHESDVTSRKKGARDADMLMLLLEIFRIRVDEIDSLLDLSLSILASASNFPQKDDLETSLKKALSLVRNIA